MSLGSLIGKPEVKRVLGVDAATHSLAFCLLEKKDVWTPEFWGKMDIHGTDISERCGDINKKLYGVLKQMDPQVAVIEAPVWVNNQSVLIKMSKIVGAATGVAVATGCQAYEVTPVTWMNYIGNPTRDTKEFKQAIMKEHPGKSKAWYKNEARRLRKERTQRWVLEMFCVDISDDDVADAFGIAWYGVEELV